MLDRLKGLYNVDTVPPLIRPFYLLFSYTIGYSMHFLFHYLLHYTSRIEIIGEDPRKTGLRCIYACWHSEVFTFFSAMRKIPNLIAINHPLWYMKPSHICVMKFGIEKLYLGSTGHGGKEAAIRLAKDLRESHYSTFMNPDGPAGPVKEIKKGTLHLAAQSGLPILPVHISSSPELRLPTWDRKLIPVPLGKITIRIGKPIYVNEDQFEEATEELRRGLDGKR